MLTMRGLLSLIRERKSKKISCDKDTLKEEVSKQLNMNENSFEFSMETLLKQDHVTENHRSGKIAYSVKLPETGKDNIENLTNDFIEFKSYVTDKLFTLTSQEDTNSQSKSSFHERSRDELIGTVADLDKCV